MNAPPSLATAPGQPVVLALSLQQILTLVDLPPHRWLRLLKSVEPIKEERWRAP